MLQTAWGNSLDTMFQDTEAIGANVLSVVVIGPDERRRDAVAGALAGSLCGIARQLPFYPEIDQLPRMIELNHDVVIVDLDSNPEYALEIVENLCAGSQATVMVVSASSDSELMIRCMRAGAREFLSMPVTQSSMAEAMVRASVRRPTVKSNKKADGRLCVFWGAKGGAGVTTIATNFAISAATEAEQKTLLIDLDLPLGDAILNLGLSPQYSTADALQNFGRLDANFLGKLTAKHSTGLCVLAAPGKIIPLQSSTEAIDRLILVARQEFDCVVVDTGSRFDLLGTALFQPSATVYLVSQVGISELRNSNRLVSEMFSSGRPKLEIILNRFSGSSLGVDEEHITRALTRKAEWRVPEDTATARKMQATATPLALSDSAISRSIKQMARVACGMSAEPEKKKKKIGLF
jgi:pilus assembly protein CpaE